MDTNKSLINSTSQNMVRFLEDEMKLRLPSSKSDQVIMDAIPYPICWRHKNGKIIGCNSSFVVLLNHSCVGETFADLFSKDELMELESVRLNVIEKNTPEYFIIEMGQITYEANESPITVDKEVVGTVLTISKKGKPSNIQKMKVIESIKSLQEHIDGLKAKHDLEM